MIIKTKILLYRNERFISLVQYLICIYNSWHANVMRSKYLYVPMSSRSVENATADNSDNRCAASCRK